MFHRLFPLVLCLGNGSCTDAPTDQQKAVVAEVEARVALPQGAGSLKCYERYYTILEGDGLTKELGVELPGKQILLAHYIVSEKPGIHWADDTGDFPEQSEHPGCGVLTLVHVIGDRANPPTATCSLTWAGTIPEEIDPPIRC